MVDRVNFYYGDESSYRRIEGGTRRPKRDAAIAILVDGLELTDPGQINSILALAGYEGMTETDRPPEQPLTIPFEGPVPAKVRGGALWDQVAKWRKGRVVGGAILAASLIIGAAVSSIVGRPGWLWIASGIMYSALYPISLFLETAYEERQPRILAASIFSFSFVLLTSTGALAADFTSINARKDYGLLLSLPIFVAAAGLQWLFVRSALPSSTIVRTRFHAHTAQSAHLKNTLYFLVTFILFWLTPIHAVMRLRRYATLGHQQSVRELLSHWLIISDGVVCPNVETLGVIFVFLLLLSIPMRSQLLDNLKPGAHTNSYINWFYARAFLYFSLCLLCLVWFAISVASLRA